MSAAFNAVLLGFEARPPSVDKTEQSLGLWMLPPTSQPTSMIKLRVQCEGSGTGAGGSSVELAAQSIALAAGGSFQVGTKGIQTSPQVGV